MCWVAQVAICDLIYVYHLLITQLCIIIQVLVNKEMNAQSLMKLFHVYTIPFPNITYRIFKS